MILGFESPDMPNKRRKISSPALLKRISVEILPFIQRFPGFIRCWVVFAILAVNSALAEEPTVPSEPTSEQANEQKTENQPQPKPQSQTRNPGVEFVPTEDISEDTSVPFPVDI